MESDEEYDQTKFLKAYQKMMQELEHYYSDLSDQKVALASITLFRHVILAKLIETKEDQGKDFFLLTAIQIFEEDCLNEDRYPLAMLKRVCTLTKEEV